MFQQIRAERGERGFTLVELLVVIAILGILAGVVVFSLSSVGNNGATEACKTEKSIVQTAVVVYKQLNAGANPATEANLTPAILGSTPTYWTVAAGVLSRTNTAAVAAALCS